MTTSLPSAPISTNRLGKRYGRKWALRDCTVEIPAGVVAALVGPNGAGKTTLLTLAAGLSKPSAGAVRIFDHDPRREATQVLPRVAFVAQEHPLYNRLRVEEMLKLGRKANPRWNAAEARSRIESLGLSLRQPVGKLSGGQQAQVALTLALAKEPDLLLLDEPVASLDPVARREFLDALTTGASMRQTTVLLSSHNIADLERVCDYLVILAAGGVRLAGSIDSVLAGHRRLTGPPTTSREAAAGFDIVREQHSQRQSTLLIRGDADTDLAGWTEADLDLEEIVLAYLDPAASQQPNTRHAGEAAS
jgi:ABC-2 type transport system ATP-binding protein